MAGDNAVFAEWLNTNMTRAYPMSQTGKLLNAIPNSLLIDASIYAPYQLIQGGYLYISHFQVLPTQVSIGIGMYYQTQYADLWQVRMPRTLDIAMTDDQIEAHTYTLAQTQALAELVQTLQWAADITGTVTAGKTVGLPWQSTIQVYSAQDNITTLHSHCIHQQTVGVSALIVGDKRLTGDIVLQAGQGIQLTVQGNTVIISADSADVTLQQAVAQLRERLGTPIVSINGVTPDDAGNFSLLGMDCTIVQPQRGGLSISNPCSKPCCGQAASSDLDTAISILQESKNTMNDYYVSLSASINAMTSRLALIISNLG